MVHVTMRMEASVSVLHLNVGDVLGSYRVLGARDAVNDELLIEARHLATQAEVTLRWLSMVPGMDLSAMREVAQRLTRIRHPNVASVLSYDEHQGRIYLVLEGLRGESLERRIERGPIGGLDACRIMHAVMCGVAEAHAQGILHGDLRPDNIILSESTSGGACVPKVLDFWVGKLATDAERERAHTLHSDVFSSYKYMSFEQLHLHDDVDGRADVYALAAILYRMLTGHLPYEAANPVDLALRMAKEQLVPLNLRDPKFSQELTLVLRRALAKDRERRYPTVGALAVAIEPFVNGTKAVFVPPAIRNGAQPESSVKARKRWARMKLPSVARATHRDWLSQMPSWTWFALGGAFLMLVLLVAVLRRSG